MVTAPAATTTLVTKDQILAKLSSGAMSIDDAKAALNAISGESVGARALYCKVSPKGALSVYGLNAQWPVTLYIDQWSKLLDFGPQIRDFGETHKSEFSHKEKK